MKVLGLHHQTTPHTAFIERVIFGWADTFSAQLHAGNQYHKLQPVFCIVITEFNVLAKADAGAVHLIFELRERNQPEVVLSNHLQIHFLRLYELLQGRLELLEGVWSANFMTAMAATSEVEAGPLSIVLIGDSAVALRFSLQSQAAIYFSNTCTTIPVHFHW